MPQYYAVPTHRKIALTKPLEQSLDILTLGRQPLLPVQVITAQRIQLGHLRPRHVGPIPGQHADTQGVNLQTQLLICKPIG